MKGFIFRFIKDVGGVIGMLYAILAAICNSFIGIFGNNLYKLNMDSMNIAFFRCFFALIKEGIIYIFALAVIPTVGGFYFTNKALNLIEAGKVQLFEMTEPFFATLLAYIVLSQVITIYDFISGFVIMIGLLILEMKNIKSVIFTKENKLIKNYTEK